MSFIKGQLREDIVEGRVEGVESLERKTTQKGSGQTKGRYYCKMSALGIEPGMSFDQLSQRRRSTLRVWRMWMSRNSIVGIWCSMRNGLVGGRRFDPRGEHFNNRQRRPICQSCR